MIDKAKFILKYEPFYFWRNVLLTLMLGLGVPVFFGSLMSLVSLWWIFLAVPATVFFLNALPGFWDSAYRIAGYTKKLQEIDG